MEEILGSIEHAKTNRVLPANEEFFFPRFWDIAAIKNNIPAFKRILTEWYTNNPTLIVKNTDGTFKRVDALTPEKGDDPYKPTWLLKVLMILLTI